MALSPSERIGLIQEISKRLSNEGYPLIDLTLKQFGLPRSERWDDSKTAYVIAMIDDAKDSALVDLALHVGVRIDEPAPRVDPPFWRKDLFRVFVTHLAAHRKVAALIQEALLDFGISAFVAHNDIEPTLEWQTQIETALTTCDSLIALLHADFHQSNWTDQEIGFAMGRGVPVFAIRFGQDPYGFIGRFQAFSAAGKTSVVLARELFDAYRKNKQTQRRMASVLVQLFDSSISFAEAKTRVGYLEDLEVWDPSYTTRITEAAKTNSQVEGAWGVPERVAKLVKKWTPL